MFAVSRFGKILHICIRKCCKMYACIPFDNDGIKNNYGK